MYFRNVTFSTNRVTRYFACPNNVWGVVKTFASNVNVSVDSAAAFFYSIFTQYEINNGTDLATKGPALMNLNHCSLGQKAAVTVLSSQ